MGFCRRCGDIVSGQRCKCGGTAVAATVQWNQLGANEDDRWSKTYVAKETPPVRPAPPTSTIQPTHTGGGSSRFPKPKSKSTSVPLSSRVADHIATATTSRPPSPLKRSTTLEDSPSFSAAEEGILQCPDTGGLSKAYGSVLQPKETLAQFACHICSTPFPPDATIYPDPSSPTIGAGTRFLCRPCFTVNGGSKGDCAACGRAVLILKSEGGFVENSGRLWHKRCFRCEGCFKNIGDRPMVDLLGRPSCADCFDSCLKRANKGSPQRFPRESDSPGDKRNNLGGTFGAKSREGSPALEELEQRLGILRSRESSPAVEERPRTQSIGAKSPLCRDSPGLLSSRYSTSIRECSPLLDRAGLKTFSDLDGTESELSTPSQPLQRRFKTPEPQARYSTPTRSRTSSPASSKPTAEAIEEMKNRFLRTSLSSPQTPGLNDSTSSTVKLSSSPPSGGLGEESPTLRRHSSRLPRASGSLRTRLSSSSLTRDREKDAEGVVIPRTPDLMSDNSDDVTSVRSSGPCTPPSLSPPLSRDDLFTPKSGLNDGITTTRTPELKSSPAPVTIPTFIPSTAKCAKCKLSLFDTHGGKYVTVPEEPSSTGIPPKTYHTDCFTCKICGGPFQEKDGGQAVFVRAQGGACHVDCAPPEKVTVKTMSSRIPTSSASASRATTATYTVPTKFDRPPTTAPASTVAFPRWGSTSACPGCQKCVSPMEKGVVPGPQGSRWHATCLVCGGKDVKRRSVRQEDRKPGCGKRLDSAAKTDGDGGVWCRECLLLLPSPLRSPDSPTRSPLVSQPTGSFWSGRSIVPQTTGTTTLARQFTGLSGGGDAALTRQLTGGGLSPTRQLSSSPTKQLGAATSGKFPRPKSVIGLRTAKSVDEGRGMFLVRQMTGGRM
ncbi:hypothetical protein GLOTRDRAFT_135433 [Gloeophyllum trabeum ATCC 11539]|uniref:LIM zinc-binding domain-containing protein n=1 Tax=Gloeophyllum trabeum (strain ATCC 11539 / FP-39264 / Madison 617) TaxID=670483 RepID=S7S4H6_GLOTA|nr:uncharacterized protein GLOTRDRAFT_135433 [Gloeophyllum trabeum ATCC 11539]EPQ60819.1 hypothetical protein GLOTRDRAFT_135433 [Gloeophyllum trabeum ATCC 11539]